MKSNWILAGIFSLVLLVLQEHSSAQINILNDALKLSGDYRFRFEQDWDSRKEDGSFRDDRQRLRHRLRFGFTYRWNKTVSFGARFRSGNGINQQSPHQTYGSVFEPKAVNIDRAYLKLQHYNWWLWLGKNSFPFLRNNEMYWSDDVTPEGIAAGATLQVGHWSVIPSAGWFVVQHSGKRFADDALMRAGQLALKNTSGAVGVEFSSAYFHFTHIPNTGNSVANHTLDYQLLVSSLRFSFFERFPVRLGADFMHNFCDYSTHKEVPSALCNQKDGWVASITAGRLKEKNDFLVGYYYAHIEKYAVVDHLAQDNWVRWGNETATFSSNFRGHEIRLAYAFGKKLNVVVRTYFVEGLLAQADGLNTQTGNRFRIDLNIGF